jgi:tRNA(Ser,Leu) C12 N-acetylase TAN1
MREPKSVSVPMDTRKKMEFAQPIPFVHKVFRFLKEIATELQEIQLQLQPQPQV